MLRKDELYTLLDKPIVSEEENIQFSEDSSGQQPDTIALMLEGSSTPFINYHEGSHDNKKLKIILAEQFLCYEEIDPRLRILLNAATCYCEVYLWQGANVPFSDLSPIHNTLEFWRSADLMVADRKETIEKSLLNQGYALDDFIILDADQILNLVKQLNDKFKFQDFELRNNTKNKHVDAIIKNHFIFRPPFNFDLMDKISKEYDCINQQTIIIEEPNFECLKFIKYNNAIGNIEFAVTSKKEMDDICEQLHHCLSLKKLRIRFYDKGRNKLDIQRITIYDSLCEEIEFDGLHTNPKITILQDEDKTKSRLTCLKLGGLFEVTIQTKSIRSIVTWLITEPWLTAFCDKNSLYLSELQKFIVEFGVFPLSISKIKQYMPNLRVLSIPYIKLDGYQTQPFQFLEELIITHFESNLNDEDINHLSYIFSNVSTLEISNINKKGERNCINLLTKLHIKKFTCQYSHVDQIITANIPHITDLELNRCEYTDLKIQLPVLKKLTVNTIAAAATINCSLLPVIQEVKSNGANVIISQRNTELKKVIIGDYIYNYPLKKLLNSNDEVEINPYNSYKPNSPDHKYEKFEIDNLNVLYTGGERGGLFGSIHFKNPERLEHIDITNGYDFIIGLLDLRDCINLQSLIIQQGSVAQLYLPHSKKLEKVVLTSFNKEDPQRKIYIKNPEIFHDYHSLRSFECSSDIVLISGKMELKYPLLEKIKLDSDTLDWILKLFSSCKKLNEISLFMKLAKNERAVLILRDNLATYEIKSNIPNIQYIVGNQNVFSLSLISYGSQHIRTTLDGFENTHVLMIDQHQNLLISNSNIRLCLLRACFSPQFRNIRIDSLAFIETREIQFQFENTKINLLDITNAKGLENISYDNVKNTSITKMKYNSDVNINMGSSLAEFNIYDSERINVIERGVSSSEVGQSITQNELKVANSITLFDSRRPDATTTSPNSLITKGAFNTELYCHPSVPLNHYRIFVTTEIEFDPFWKSLTFDHKPRAEDLKPVTNIRLIKLKGSMIQATRALVDRLPKMVLSYVGGKLPTTEFIPLTTESPLASPNDISEIYSNHPELIKGIFYHERKSQLFFTVSKEIPDMQILGLYQRNKKKISPIAISKELRKYLDNYFENELSKDEALYKLHQKLKNIDIPEQMRLQELINYCRFDPKVLQKGMFMNDVDLILEELRQRSGVCRHRAQAFLLMAAYYGFPAAMIESTIHAFVETARYVTEEKNGVIVTNKYWKPVDLGGGRVSVLLDADAKASVFHTVESTKPVATIPTSTASNASTSNINSTNTLTNSMDAGLTIFTSTKNMTDLTEEEYFTILKRLVETQPTESFSTLLQTTLAPLLIQNNYAELDYIINQLCVGEVLGQPVLYINDPKQFHDYMLARQITDDGKRIALPGALAEKIKSGGIILVNWANFSANELASYQGLIDANPTLFGLLTNKLKVLGVSVLNGTYRECSSFLSRCQRMQYIGPTLLSEESAPTSAASSRYSEPVVIDCFGLPDWRESLGEVILNGDHYTLIKNQLLLAFENGSPLIIIQNLPNDDRCKKWLDTIKKTKSLSFNGKTIKVTSNITTQSFESETKLSNVHLHHDAKPPNDRELIYLSAQNWYQLFSHIIYKNRMGFTKEGFLTKANKYYFIIHGNLLLGLWQKMIAKIKQKYGKVEFEFYLSPGAKIGNFAASNLDAINITSLSPVDCSKQTANQVIVSNDPNCYISMYKKLDPAAKIIHVKPTQGIDDFTFKATLISNDPPRFATNYEKMLADLQDGKTVILSGNISKDLYQALYPLLLGHRKLFINGEWVKITGRLLLVLPTSCMNYLKINHYGEFHYKDKDYLPLIAPEDQKIAELVFTFYEMARGISFSGTGKPPHLDLHYFHLRTLIAAYKLKLHPHNPIKNIFHYDFPKNSKEYAYLAVAAKWLFAKDDASVANLKRLKNILKDLSDDEIKKLIANDPWHILNCFRGKELRQILGDKWEGAITKGLFPVLKVNAAERLLLAVKNNLIQQKELVETDKSQNKKNAFHTLLYSKDWPVIFLKGEPGTSKTHSVEDLEDSLGFPVYKIETDFMKWLMSPETEEPVVLLIDEGNLNKPGMLDNLFGIYFGQIYEHGDHPITQNKKIVVTGNQETYPNRYYHDFLRDCAITIYYPLPSKKAAKKLVQTQLIHLEKKDREIISESIVKIYDLAREMNPNYKYSIRDLNSFTERFLLLEGTKAPMDYPMLIFQAAKHEFIGNFNDEIIKQRFLAILMNQLDIQETQLESSTTHDVIWVNGLPFPSEMADIIASIREDLKMRDQAIKNGVPGFFKKAVMLEGAIGLGKSTLLQALLEEHGIYHVDKAPPGTPDYNKYMIINVIGKESLTVEQNENLKNQIREAEKRSICLILDEINLNNSLEEPINPALSKRNKPPKNETEKAAQHFMIFATQNIGAQGRHAQSQAVRSRMHVHSLAELSQKSLELIAEHQGIQQPEVYVKVFNELQKTYQDVNNRTYYQGIKDVKKWQAQEKKFTKGND